MRLYQFFRIRGVAIKMFFPMPSDVISAPVQWSLCYSQNEVLFPQLATSRAQTLASYQTGSCNQNRPISRFYNTAKTYRRFGIQYCDTLQYPNFNLSADNYGSQLLANQGSSVNMKVFRQLDEDPDVDTPARTIGRFQVTYYVTYKGTKG